MRTDRFNGIWKSVIKRKQSRWKDFKKCKSYSLFVLSESELTGVSAIITSKGCFYKFLRIFILVFSVIGFLYQTFQFLQLYWEYSTVQLVRDMKTMIKPAITICDENLYRRKYICTERPTLCQWEPDEMEFCSEYRTLCENDHKMLAALPHLESYPDDFFDMNFTKASGFRIEDSIFSCTWYSDNFEEQIQGKKDEHNKTKKPVIPGQETEEKSRTLDTACGKPKFIRAITQEKYPVSCYALYSQTEDENYTSETFETDTTKEHSFPKKPRAYRLSFHHPAGISNPFDEGLSFQEGQTYKVLIHQVNIERLSRPYVSDCHDYLTEWYKNGGYGPLHKQDCQQICEIKVQSQNEGCVFRESTYPHEEKICPTSPPYNSKLNSEIRKCFEKCKDACLEIKYVSRKDILNQIQRYDAMDTYGSGSFLSLQIQFEVSESKVYFHRQKYESVEMFSHVGGYLGIWLGWCLLAVLDFFGTILRICNYPFMTRRKQICVHVL